MVSLFYAFSGLTVPWVCFEGIFSTFKWQRQCFPTLSYLHKGADKIWYVVSHEDNEQFDLLQRRLSEQLSQQQQSQKQLKQPQQQTETQWHRQSTGFVTTDELVENGCNVRRCIQKEGQYVVIELDCWYCSIATGYSVSESIHFASLDWLAGPTFSSFQVSLGEEVITKTILSFATAECKKQTMSPYNKYLIPKLQDIQKLIVSCLNLIKESVGITETVVLKEPVSSPCAFCRKLCYLVRVAASNMEPEGCMCVEDAVHGVAQRGGNTDGVSVLLAVDLNELQRILSHLEGEEGELG